MITMSVVKKRGRPPKDKTSKITEGSNLEESDVDCGKEKSEDHLEPVKPRKGKPKKNLADHSPESTNDSGVCKRLSPEASRDDDASNKRRVSRRLASSFSKKADRSEQSVAEISTYLDEDLFKTSTPCAQSSKRKRRNKSGTKEIIMNDSAKPFHNEEEHPLTQSKDSPTKCRRKRPSKKCLTLDEPSLGGDHSDQSVQLESGGKNKKVLTCCHCGKGDLNYAAMRHHMALKHHRIWSVACLEGKFSELGTFKILQTIRCLKCDKLCHTFALFRIHSKWCGREEERADCHICGKSVRLMTYNAHVNYVHKEKPKDKVKEKGDSDGETAANISSNTGRTVRRAAVKARTKLREMTMELGASSVVSYSEPQYVCPQHAFPANFVKSLETEMKKHQKLSCCYKGCFSSHTDISEHMNHLLACSFRPDFVVSKDAFTCLGCGKFFETGKDVADHVTEHSWGKNKGCSDSESGTNNFSGSESTDEDEESSDEDEEDDGDYEDGRIRGSTKSVKSQKRLLSAKTLFQNHSYSDLFPRWRVLPSLYKEVSENDGRLWLPQNLDRSFKIQTGADEFSPVVRLGLYEAYFYNESYSINVGGPLWAMAWCPAPPEKAVSQFLAIYSHPTENETHLVNECSSQMALIQLWKFQLHDYKAVESEKPEFVSGLLLECGPIWAMSWCPTGAWEDIASAEGSSTAERTMNEGISRIGLLAIACHSGHVHILSIPSSFSSNDLEVNKQPTQRLFRASPVATLLRRGNIEMSPCLCLDWHWKEKCGLIAAGFSDGTVCLWDLNTSSLLLHCVNANGCDLLFAYRIMRCHVWPVKGVAFCPSRDNIMVTCSSDRLVKVWDLLEPENPLSSLVNTMNTAVLWPMTSTDSFICAGDDCFQCERNNATLCVYAKNKIQTRPLTVHNGTVWGMSFNCQTGFLVSCDSAGVVMKIPWLSPSQKCVSELREVLVVVENNSNSLDVKASLQNSGSSDKTDESSCHTNDMPTIAKDKNNHRFQHCQPQQHLTFKDFNSKWKFSDVNLYYSNQLPADNIPDSLSCAIYRVAWNTNTDCTGWLAMGGQAGILRIKLVENRKN